MVLARSPDSWSLRGLARLALVQYVRVLGGHVTSLEVWTGLSVPPLFQSTLLQKRQTALCSKCLCLDPTFVDSGADRLLFPELSSPDSSSLSLLGIYTCDLSKKRNPRVGSREPD